MPSDGVPEHLKIELEKTQTICMDFLTWLRFCMLDTGRDPTYFDNHLLSVAAQDYLETISGGLHLMYQGVHRPVIREARFILEMSIKLAYTQQNAYDLSIVDKLQAYKKQLNSPNITVMRSIKLWLMQDDLLSEFYTYCGRLYGKSSNYVHLSVGQVQERFERVEKGQTIGYETESDLKGLNSFLEQVYAAAIVFIIHSIPSNIAGDWLVDSSGRTTHPWHFIKSKFVASIDSYFDYKAERQDELNIIQASRANNIEF